MRGSTGTFMPPMPQTACRVHPTRTEFVFEADGIELQMNFTTPMLPDAASNRLHVALSEMRKMGLADAIQYRRGGWMLDPAMAIATCTETAAEAA